MTQTPYVDEEELKRIMAEEEAQYNALQSEAPSYNPKNLLKKNKM